MEREGVIQYRLEYRNAPALPLPELAELQHWRARFQALGILGQEPSRYGGLGFGNLSVRLPPFDAPPGRRTFLISGSQTAGKPVADAGDYAQVLGYDFAQFLIRAEGPVKPSSEALTHAMIYDLDAGVRVVMHVHSPAIWGQAAELGLPCTVPEAGYGTREMADEVKRLHAAGHLAGGLFVMGGHQDGVVAFGADINQVGRSLERIAQQAQA